MDRTRNTFGLSQRELQILSQLHKGAPLKEFANSLFITESTLKTHLSSIYRKMDVKNRVQAIEKAKQAGLT
jgi:DNA-binding CsgD family transcriptional regulator